MQTSACRVNLIWVFWLKCLLDIDSQINKVIIASIFVSFACWQLKHYLFRGKPFFSPNSRRNVNRKDSKNLQQESVNLQSKRINIMRLVEDLKEMSYYNNSNISIEYINFSLERKLLHRTKGMLTLTNKQTDKYKSKSKSNTNVTFCFWLTLLINGGES